MPLRVLVPGRLSVNPSAHLLLRSLRPFSLKTLEVSIAFLPFDCPPVGSCTEKAWLSRFLPGDILHAVVLFSSFLSYVQVKASRLLQLTAEKGLWGPFSHLGFFFFFGLPSSTTGKYEAYILFMYAVTSKGADMLLSLRKNPELFILQRRTRALNQKALWAL